MANGETTLLEEWLPIPGYDGNYAASNLGRIKRTGGGPRAVVGGIVKAHPGSRGYVHVRIGSGSARTGTWSTVTVHRLVALAFLGPCPPGRHVDHINGVKTDNRACNLEYVTPSENTKRAWADGRCVDRTGSHNTQAKVTEAQVLEIRRLYAEGAMTQAALGERYGLRDGHVSRIINRKAWAHV